jgi:anti-anti-sigma regulatory factor
MNDPDCAPCAATSPNVLRLEGNADIAAARRLVAIARERAAAPGDVVVDASGLGRLDGAGAQILIALQKTLAESGRRLVVEGVPERSFAMMLLTGVGQALVSGAGPTSAEAPPPAEPTALDADEPEPAAARTVDVDGDADADIDPDALFARPQ